LILATIIAAVIAAATSGTLANGSQPKLTTRIAEMTVATWSCEDHLGTPRTRASVSPWQLPKPKAYRRWVLNLWTLRHASCAKRLDEKKRQWNWQAWLPPKWYRVGSCETGYGGDPNWFHANSSYVSAFGIQRGNFNGAYDDDARRVGMPPWSDDARKRPTPWQQYLTAVSHHDRFGGFSGWGCRNA